MRTGECELCARLGKFLGFSALGEKPEEFGDIVAVSPPALGSSLHVERLTIGVEELSCKGTGNGPV